MDNEEKMRVGDQSFDFPSKTELTYKELIVQRLNYWKNKHIERVVSYREAVARREKFPQEMIVVGTNQHTGQDITLSMSAIVEKRRPAAIESLYHVQTLEKMLDDVNKSEDALAENWSDEALSLPEDMQGIKSDFVPKGKGNAGGGGGEETSKV